MNQQDLPGPRSVGVPEEYKNHPLLPEGYLKLGICYEQQGQFTDAWKTYHQARMKFVTDSMYTEIKKREDDILAVHPDLQREYSTQTKLKRQIITIKTLLSLREPLSLKGNSFLIRAKVSKET